MEPEEVIYAEFEQAVKNAVAQNDNPAEIAEDTAEAADAAIQKLLYTAPALAILGIDEESGEAKISFGFNGISAMSDSVGRDVPLSAAFLPGDLGLAEVEELIRAVEKSCAIARQACNLPNS